MFLSSGVDHTTAATAAVLTVQRGPFAFAILHMDDLQQLLPDETLRAVFRHHSAEPLSVGVVEWIAKTFPQRLRMIEGLQRRYVDLRPEREAYLGLPVSRAPVLPIAGWASLSPVEKDNFVEAARKYGHYFCDFPQDTYQALRLHGMKLAHALSHATERTKFEMEPELRTWGYHALDFKGKQCFKVRYCKDMIDRWTKVKSAESGVQPQASNPTVPPLPALSEVLSTYMTAYDMTLFAVTPILQWLGLSDQAMHDLLLPEQQCIEENTDAFASSFHEFFHYCPFPEYAESPSVAVPCEEHTDVGLITLTMKSEGGVDGLQVFSWEDGWVRAEPAMPPESGRCLLLFGEILEHLSSSRFVATPHRVVIPKDATVPRYSQIFEILPHPCSIVPELLPPQSAAELHDGDSLKTGKKQTKPLLGKEIFE